MKEIIYKLIEEYKQGNNEPLDSDEVETLINLLRLEVDLNEGNITQQEYNNLIVEFSA
jgi:hypothetical protein